MRRLRSGLWAALPLLLTLACSNGGSGGPDPTPVPSVTPTPDVTATPQDPCDLVDCGVRHCRPTDGACVECLEDMHCDAEGERPLCDGDRFVCVGCLDDSGCRVGCETCSNDLCALTEGTCCADSDCAEGARCDAEQNFCVACLDDADCEGGETCDAGACVPAAECQIDTDCGFLRRCDGLGRCADCLTDGDCGPGQGCDPETGQCIEARPCTGDGNCLAGRLCEETREICVDVICEDDAQEPDGRGEAPAAIDAGTHERVLCPNDLDAFRVPAQPGAGVRATVRFDDVNLPPSSFELQLVNANREIEAGESSRGEARLERTELGEDQVHDGEIWLVLQSRGGTSAYTLELEVADEGFCAPDPWEPDNTPETALELLDRVTPATLCAGDIDRYRVSAPPGVLVDVSLDEDAIRAGLSLVAERETPEGLELVAEGASLTLPHSQTPRDFIVTVSGSEALPLEGQAYEISLEDRPPNETCDSATPIVFTDDAATVFGTTSLAGAELAPQCEFEGRDIAWVFELDEPRALNLRAEIDIEERMSLEVRSENCLEGTRYDRGCQDSESGAVVLDIPRLPRGRHFVILHVFGEERVQLDALLSDPAPAAADSCAEPGEVRIIGAGSTRISGTTAGMGDDHSGCDAEGRTDAVYELLLPEPAFVRVTLPEGEGNQTQLYLRQNACESEAEADALFCAPDTGGVFDASVEAGRYWLVFETPAAGDGYEADIEVTPALPVFNEACNESLPLAFDRPDPPAFRGTTWRARDDIQLSCGGGSGGDVVYRLNLPSDAVLGVNVDTFGTFTPAVEVRRSPCGGDDSVVGCLAAEEGEPGVLRGELLVSAGIHYLVVDSADEGGFFDLELSLGEPPQLGNDCDAPRSLSFEGGRAQFRGDTRLGIDSDSACGGEGEADQVWRFTLDTDSRVLLRFDPGQGAGNANSAVYLRGADCAGGAELMCEAGFAPFARVLELDAGDHHLFVDGFAPERGTFAVEIEQLPDATASGGGQCTGPQTLALNPDDTLALTLAGDTTGAPNQYLPACDEVIGHSAGEEAFFFALASRRELNAELLGEGAMSLSLLSGDCDTGESQACIVGLGRSTLRATLEPGAWFIVVDGQGDNTGEFQLSLALTDTASAGPDDCFSGAPIELGALPGEVELVGGTDGLDDDFETSHCGGAGAPDALYTLLVPEGGGVLSAAIDTSGAWDGVLSLIEGECRNGSRTNDCVLSSRPSDRLQAGLAEGSYHLVIDGVNPDDAGLYSLILSFDAGLETGGNSCVAPAAFTAGPSRTVAFAHGDTSATTDSDAACGSNEGSDQAWALTLGESSWVDFDLTTAGSFDAVMYLRPGCPSAPCGTDSDCGPGAGSCFGGGCAGCALPGASRGAQRLRTQLDAGEWFVVVDGATEADSGAYRLVVESDVAPPAPRNCAEATAQPALTFAGSDLITLRSSTIGAGDDLRAGCAFDTGAPDRVFAVQLSEQTELTAVVEGLPAGSLRAAVEIRSSCEDPQSALACDAPVARGPRARTASLAPGTYYVIVDGQLAQEAADFELELRR